MNNIINYVNDYIKPFGKDTNPTQSLVLIKRTLTLSISPSVEYFEVIDELSDSISNFIKNGYYSTLGSEPNLSQVPNDFRKDPNKSSIVNSFDQFFFKTIYEFRSGRIPNVMTIDDNALIIRNGVIKVLQSIPKFKSTLDPRVTLYVSRDRVYRNFTMSYNPEFIFIAVIQTYLKYKLLGDNVSFTPNEETLKRICFYFVAHEISHILFGHLSGVKEYDVIYGKRFSNQTFDSYINKILDNILVMKTPDSGVSGCGSIRLDAEDSVEKLKTKGGKINIEFSSSENNNINKDTIGMMCQMPIRYTGDLTSGVTPNKNDIKNYANMIAIFLAEKGILQKINRDKQKEEIQKKIDQDAARNDSKQPQPPVAPQPPVDASTIPIGTIVYIEDSKSLGVILGYDASYKMYNVNYDSPNLVTVNNMLCRIIMEDILYGRLSQHSLPQTSPLMNPPKNSSILFSPSKLKVFDIKTMSLPLYDDYCLGRLVIDTYSKEIGVITRVTQSGIVSLNIGNDDIDGSQEKIIQDAISANPGQVVILTDPSVITHRNSDYNSQFSNLRYFIPDDNTKIQNNKAGQPKIGDDDSNEPPAAPPQPPQSPPDTSPMNPGDIVRTVDGKIGVVTEMYIKYNIPYYKIILYDELVDHQKAIVDDKLNSMGVTI